jgi:hypothetical protein
MLWFRSDVLNHESLVTVGSKQSPLRNPTKEFVMLLHALNHGLQEGIEYQFTFSWWGRHQKKHDDIRKIGLLVGDSQLVQVNCKLTSFGPFVPQPKSNITVATCCHPFLSPSILYKYNLSVCMHVCIWLYMCLYNYIYVYMIICGYICTYVQT